MKRVADIANKLQNNNENFSKMINEKILRDRDIINFIEKNNITKELFKENIQTFYDFYRAKDDVKNTHTPKLKYLNDAVYLEFDETPEQKKINEERKLSNRIKTEYISKSVLYSNFANLSKGDEKAKLAMELLELCDRKLANQSTKGIYIYGKTGIGKSYLMGCVYNYFKANGKEPAIIYFPEFVRKMKAKIFNGEYNYIIDEIRAQDILIIDDLGAENITDFVRDEILVPIINYRSAENLLTFFTSNLSIADLSDTLSVTKNTVDETKAMRILDRVRHLAKPIYLDAVNEREYL